MSEVDKLLDALERQRELMQDCATSYTQRTSALQTWKQLPVASPHT